jgi:Undecaprenyl-phosphate glucose phosphotransferase
MRTSPDKLLRVVAAEKVMALGEPAHTAADDLRVLALSSMAQAPLVSKRVISTSMRAAEGLLVLMTGLVIAHFYPGFGEWANPVHYVPMVLASSIAFPLIAQGFGLYRVAALLAPGRHISKLAASWCLLFATIAIGVLFTKAGAEYSRVWLFSWFFGGLSALTLSRAIATMLVRRWNQNGQLDRHAVLVGGGQPAAELVAALAGSHGSDVSVVGVFDDRDNARSPAQIAGLPKLGNVSELVEFVRKARIDLLLITLPLAAEERLLQILKRLWVLPVDIRLSAYSQKLHYRPRAYSYIGNVPFLDVFDKPLGEWGSIVKAIEDKVIAALAVVLLSPVMALVALAIKLESRGPVFFKQKRYGFNNELIEVFKFRSMFHNMADADASRLVTKGDPRVTRVGRFIRRTSLDELPQFFNVLRGELSLVGPRPHATKAKAADRLYTEVVDGYFARHRVKPGITGWAQINGWRGETDTTEKLQRRVDHDLYYIENWSLALDLYILWRTPLSLLNGENSY